MASVCNLDTLVNTNILLLTKDYNEQLFVLRYFRVISFHDEPGQVVADTTTAADPQILKATGDAATPTAAANRRAANIKYVTVETNIDFTQITEDNSSRFRMSTVIELPMTSAQINDNVADVITVTTYHDPADSGRCPLLILRTKS